MTKWVFFLHFIEYKLFEFIGRTSCRSFKIGAWPFGLGQSQQKHGQKNVNIQYARRRDRRRTGVKRQKEPLLSHQMQHASEMFLFSILLEGRDGISDRIWLRAAGSRFRCGTNPRREEKNPPRRVSLSFFFLMAGSWNLDWLGKTSHRDKIFFSFFGFPKKKNTIASRGKYKIKWNRGPSSNALRIFTPAPSAPDPPQSSDAVHCLFFGWKGAWSPATMQPPPP